MSKKFFILLEEFSKKPTAEIGQLSKSISKLVTLGIPVPKAICIPTSTLQLIAKKNSLNTKIKKLIKETNFNDSLSKNKSIKKIKNLILKQNIPKDLSKEFLKLYHKDLRSSFVLIQGSAMTVNSNVLIQNIKGDANVVDAFLEVWSKSVERTFNSKNTGRNLSIKTDYINKIIFPTPVLIQQQIDSEISGLALTFDENDGNKKRLTIKGVWGILHNNLNNASTYIVDSRTFGLIKKSNKIQKEQFIRNLSTLKKRQLSSLKQKKSVLSDVQASNLAKIISKISRLSISQLEIDWGMQNNVFFVNKIRETTHNKRSSKQAEETLKKIYVSVTKDQDNKTAKKYANGICILNSGRLLSLLGDHPMRVARSSQKKLLIQAVSKTILKYSSSWTDNSNSPHIIYRSQNLTSNELSRLKHSSNYETRETNPYLGFRGASRILGQHQIFNMELDIIRNLLEKTENKISLLIPFVRSPGELSQVIKLIEKSKLTKNINFDIWLELSTPENILNISKYPLDKIKGFVFNTKSIYSLIIGVDSTSKNIYSKYSENTSVVIDLIKNITSSINALSKKKSLIEEHKLLVDLTDFDSGIMKDVINQSIEGIIVNSKVTAIAKKCIINEEKEKIIS